MLTNHIGVFAPEKRAHESFGGRDVLMMISPCRHSSGSSQAAGCYPPLGPRLRGSVYIEGLGSCHAFSPQHIQTCRCHRLGVSWGGCEVCKPTGTLCPLAGTRIPVTSLPAPSPPSYPILQLGSNFPGSAQAAYTDQSLLPISFYAKLSSN